MLLNLFHLFHRISFNKIDPLGDGLREQIEAERLEPDAITLEEGTVEGELEQRWQIMEEEISHDPDWFHVDE